MNTYLFLILLFINISLYNSAARIPADYEVAPWHAWKQGAITYSFDDGCSGQLNYALHALNKHGFKATFNLVTE